MQHSKASYGTLVKLHSCHKYRSFNNNPAPQNNPIYHYTVRIAKPKPELFQEQVRLMTTNSYENAAFEAVLFKQKSVSCNTTRVKRKRTWWSSSKDRDLPYAVINHIVRTWREMCENLTCPWMHLLLTGKFPEIVFWTGARVNLGTRIES